MYNDERITCLCVVQNTFLCVINRRVLGTKNIDTIPLAVMFHCIDCSIMKHTHSCFAAYFIEYVNGKHFTGVVEALSGKIISTFTTKGMNCSKGKGDEYYG